MRYNERIGIISKSIARRRKRNLCALAVLMLAACSPIVDNRGYSTQALDMSQVNKGTSRMEDVQAVLGSPSARSDFGQPSWYYISTQKETVGLFAPEVTKQRVTEIVFDEAGVVEDIRTYEKKDGKPVTLVDKTTPSAGHSLTFMEQLLGNFGKFGTPGRAIDPGRGY